MITKNEIIVARLATHLSRMFPHSEHAVRHAIDIIKAAKEQLNETEDKELVVVKLATTIFVKYTAMSTKDAVKCAIELINETKKQLNDIR